MPRTAESGLRVRSPEEQRRWTVLNRSGVLLVVLGALLFALPLALEHGMYAFAPCDRFPPEIGYTVTLDGQLAVETGPMPATDIEEVVVLSGPDPSARGSRVIWSVERAGTVSAGWSGEVVLGIVPDGFRETVPLDVPLTEAVTVEVRDLCTVASAPLPDGALVPGVVRHDDCELPLDEFRAASDPFPPCTPDSGPHPVPFVGLALVALGLGLVVVAGLRYGPRPARP